MVWYCCAKPNALVTDPLWLVQPKYVSTLDLSLLHVQVLEVLCSSIEASSIPSIPPTISGILGDQKPPALTLDITSRCMGQ